MVFDKITHEFQTRNDAPNSNFMNDKKYTVIDDNSDIAKKIIEFYPYIKVVENENGDIVNILEDEELRAKEQLKIEGQKEIKELKEKLFNTDYQAIKFAEGLISEEEYAPIKEERQSWRDRINELEAQLEV